MTETAESLATLWLERLISRTLTVGTYGSMAVILAGATLMLVTGVDPLTAPPAAFDVRSVIADLVALRPAGFLWTGIALVIAFQVGRVVLELIGALAQRDRTMALIASGILVVVAVAIGVALG